MTKSSTTTTEVTKDGKKTTTVTEEVVERRSSRSSRSTHTERTSTPSKQEETVDLSESEEESEEEERSVRRSRATTPVPGGTVGAYCVAQLCVCVRVCVCVCGTPQCVALSLSHTRPFRDCLLCCAYRHPRWTPFHPASPPSAKLRAVGTARSYRGPAEVVVGEGVAACTSGVRSAHVQMAQCPPHLTPTSCVSRSACARGGHCWLVT